MSLGESIIALWENTNILVLALWVSGLILFSIEFFQPMRGIAYILGILLIAAGFAVRMIIGSPGEAFVFLWITIVVLFVLHVVALFTKKRDWLRAVRLKRAGERNKGYGSLIDSVGVAVTPIDLSGNVTVNDINLAVYSETPIAQGERVRISRVVNDKIIVEKISEEESTKEEPENTVDNCKHKKPTRR